MEIEKPLFAIWLYFQHDTVQYFHNHVTERLVIYYIWIIIDPVSRLYPELSSRYCVIYPGTV